MAAAGILMMIMLVSFIMTCGTKAEKKDTDDDNAVGGARVTEKQRAD